MLENEEELLDLSDGQDERTGYQIKPELPENGYVKNIYLTELPTLEMSKNENLMLVFRFTNKDGGTFRFNFTNPTNTDSPKVRGMKIQQLKHLISAYIATPYMTKLDGKIEVKVKPELNDIPPKSFKDLCEYLISTISEGFQEIPSTVKLVGTGNFPLVTPFVANVWNQLDPKKHFKWNPDYDKITESKKKDDKPDNEEVSDYLS